MPANFKVFKKASHGNRGKIIHWISFVSDRRCAVFTQPMKISPYYERSGHIQLSLVFRFSFDNVVQTTGRQEDRDGESNGRKPSSVPEGKRHGCFRLKR
jgi:hypothetical protein